MAGRDLDLELERELNNHLRNQSTEPFTVKDDKSADWALRKIREHEAHIVEVEAFAEERIHEIQAWAESATKSARNAIEHLTGLLEVYHRQLHAENPQLKTIKLPAGEIQLRKQPPKYLRDDARLLAWLKANRPEFIRVTEAPDWGAVKKAFVAHDGLLVDPDTGEVVDGVAVEESAEPAFYVRTQGGAK